MKKWAILIAVVALVLAVAPTHAVKPDKSCVSIQDGVLAYSAGHHLEGEPLMTGFDPYGYNYQSHMFNGSYANSYLGKDGFPPYDGDDEAYLAENPDAEVTWYWPYRDVTLMMKWSDEWISNKDCNEDDKLDRGYSCDPDLANSSACAGSWLTNHQRGVNEDGSHWEYFVKIVTPDTENGDYKTGDYWYTVDDEVIGSVIWGAYARILQVSNDPNWDEHGVLNNWEAPTGFGFYNP